MLDRLFRLSAAAARALAVLTMLLLGGLVLLITLDVSRRTLGAKPLSWTSDVAEYILLYATFLPMAAIVRDKGHVFVEFLRAALPPSAQRALERGVYAVCLVICVYLAWIASVHLVTAVRTGAYDTRAFDMPRWLVYVPMAIGLWLSSVEWLRFLLGRASLYDLDALQRDGY